MNKFENQKCLLVDDFSTARRIIKTTLQEIGFSCHEAENGKQAISLIKQTTFDLVIADINMPEMNGLELLKDIRSDDNMKDLIVVLSLLEPFDDIISEARKLGMDGYLVKPFDAFTLSKTLDKVIKTTGGESL